MDLGDAQDMRSLPGPKFPQFHAVFGNTLSTNRLPPSDVGNPRSTVKHLMCLKSVQSVIISVTTVLNV